MEEKKVLKKGESAQETRSDLIWTEFSPFSCREGSFFFPPQLFPLVEGNSPRQHLTCPCREELHLIGKKDGYILVASLDIPSLLELTSMFMQQNLKLKKTAELPQFPDCHGTDCWNTLDSFILEINN